MVYIWDPPIRNLLKIRLRSFLYEGTISKKNQPEVSCKVVSILRVLTVVRFDAPGRIEQKLKGSIILCVLFPVCKKTRYAKINSI